MKPVWGYLGQTTLLTSAMKWIIGPSGLKWKWSSTQRKEMTNSLGVCRSATAQYRDKFHRESNRSISQHKSTDISCIRLKLSTLICRQEYTSQHQITIFQNISVQGEQTDAFIQTKEEIGQKFGAFVGKTFIPTRIPWDVPRSKMSVSCHCF